MHSILKYRITVSCDEETDLDAFGTLRLNNLTPPHNSVPLSGRAASEGALAPELPRARSCRVPLAVSQSPWARSGGGL